MAFGCQVIVAICYIVVAMVIVCQVVVAICYMVVAMVIACQVVVAMVFVCLFVRCCRPSLTTRERGWLTS